MTVRAVLSNAKYTGRQVWNRQPGQYTPPHLPGPFKTQRWAGTDQWVISKHLAHPALVSEVDFIAAQQITAIPAPVDSGVRDYRLAGLLRCRSCRRRLDSCWSHGRPAYRCRHGHTSAKPHGGGGPSNLYVREDLMIDVIRGLLPDRSAGWTCLQTVQHLRRHQLVVNCAEFACSLEPMFPT